MKKVLKINSRVKDEEYDKFNELVKKSKLNKSEFIRRSVLNKEIIVIDGVRELVFELKKIGNNLNQLTRAVNSGMVKDLEELKGIKADLRVVFQKLIIALKKVNK